MYNINLENKLVAIKNKNSRINSKKNYYMGNSNNIIINNKLNSKFYDFACGTAKSVTIYNEYNSNLIFMLNKHNNIFYKNYSNSFTKIEHQSLLTNAIKYNMISRACYQLNGNIKWSSDLKNSIYIISYDFCNNMSQFENFLINKITNLNFNKITVNTESNLSGYFCGEIINFNENQNYYYNFDCNIICKTPNIQDGIFYFNNVTFIDILNLKITSNNNNLIFKKNNVFINTISGNFYNSLLKFEYNSNIHLNSDIDIYNSHIIDTKPFNNPNNIENVTLQANTYIKYCNYNHTHKNASPLVNQKDQNENPYFISLDINNNFINDNNDDNQNINLNLLNLNNTIQYSGFNIRRVFIISRKYYGQVNQILLPIK